MDASRTRWFRLSLFGLLYFVQGAVLAYFASFMKPYLNEFDVDADTIGLLASILLLPFVLKIFIGILSDRVNLFGLGHRKPYIVLGVILSALMLGIGAFVSPGENLILFAALMFLASLSVNLFDTTTDGLAIDITPHNEHGTVQGVMSGGRAVGLVVLSTLFGVLAVNTAGYQQIFLIMAGLMLVPLVLVIPMREPTQRQNHQQFEWSAFKALLAPRFLIFAAYAIVIAFAAYGANGLITYHMDKTFNASAGVIGNYGSLRGLGAVGGALLAGILLDRIGRREITYVGLIGISITAILLAFAPNLDILIPMGVLWGIAWGFQDVVFVALAMDLSDTRIAASMFAFMMAFFNIGTALGEGIATGLTDNIGFAGVFYLLAAINLAAIPLIFGLFRLVLKPKAPIEILEPDPIAASG